MAEADTLYTEADIIALKQAMKTGARSVTTSDGKSVALNSPAENMALLAQMKREVYGTGTNRRQRVQYLRIKSEGS